MKLTRPDLLFAVSLVSIVAAAALDSAGIQGRMAIWLLGFAQGLLTQMLFEREK